MLIVLTCYRQDGYIPPKQPYSLTLMLNNILYFAATMLVDNGRVSIWMPTANDEDGEVGIPHLEAMELVSCCVQKFNKCEFATLLDGIGGQRWLTGSQGQEGS